MMDFVQDFRELMDGASLWDVREKVLADLEAANKQRADTIRAMMGQFNNVPSELCQYLIGQGYAVDHARSAFEEFTANGGWKSTDGTIWGNVLTGQKTHGGEVK